MQQVQYAFVELPKMHAQGPVTTAAERWAWLFRYASSLEDLPPGLDDAQRAVLELANEATFSAPEHEAYHRVFDEIEQARQLARDAAAAGEARGEARGLAVVVRQLTRRLGRSLTDGDVERVRERLAALGAERLGDVVLDVSPDALAAWLADPNAS